MLNEDGSPAPQPVAPIVPEPVAETPPDYSNPNDLDFELTEEQEKDFVEQILKDGNYTPEPVKEEPVIVPAPAVPVKETPVVPVAPVEPVKVEPVKTPTEVTAPQSDDLWIEVEQVITDELGEEKTETIKLTFDPSDPSSFIPDDFTAKSTKQLAEIMDAKAEMAKLFEERKTDFDKGQATKAAGDRETALIASWDQEIADLIKSGVLEEPKVKEGDKDYNDDPSVKKTNEVFAYLTEQNAQRVKDGIPPIQSFSLAYTMFENDAKRLADVEAKKKEDEDTKKAGAMVGGGSAASGGSAEPKAYTSGKYNNIWSIPIEE